MAQGLGVMLVPRLGRLSVEGPVRRIRLSGEPVPARRILATTRKGGAGHPLVMQALDLIQATAGGLLSDGVSQDRRR